MQNLLNTKQNNTKILLICDNTANAEKTKGCLKEDMRTPWNIIHYVNMKEAKPRINSADIIILDLTLERTHTSKELFRNAQHLSTETPIIVLTGRKKHNLCTYVMERGAADTLVRGGFGRLVDAIEFALIRQTITKATSEKVCDQQKERRNIRYVEAIKANKISDEKDQCIAWMHGGYSVQSSIGKEAA